MGIQINGQTDTVTSTTAGGSVKVTPFTASTGLNVGTGASVSSPATNVLTLGTNNSERVRVGAAGSVGIGTNDPSATLAIHDDAANPNSTPILYIQRPNNIAPGNLTNANADLRIKSHSSNRKIYVEDHNSSPLFLLKGDGTIGIGTTNSSSKLQVQGTIGLGASDDLEYGFPGGRTKLTSSPSGFVINHNDNSATIFQNQGVERARISTSGNLGIGTNNPLGVLAVSGGISNPTITFQNGSTSNTAPDALVGGIVGYSRTTGGNINIGSVDIRTDTASASSGAVRILTASNGVLAETFRVDSSGRVTTPYQPMAYVTYTGAALVRGTVIPFTAVTNQGNHWNNGSYRFTCPVAGIYHASLNITGNTTQSVQVQTYVRQNGNNMAISYYPGGPVSISILCAANDTIDFVYNHDNAGYPGATPAYASVHLVG